MNQVSKAQSTLKEYEGDQWAKVMESIVEAAKDHSMEATLWQLIINLPDPGNPSSKLFHSVNMMVSKEAAILHFHPSKSQNARDVVAGLCIYLKGLWQGMIDNSKTQQTFHGHGSG